MNRLMLRLPCFDWRLVTDKRTKTSFRFFALVFSWQNALKLCVSTHVFKNIFQWPQRVFTDFLKTGLKKLTPSWRITIKYFPKILESPKKICGRRLRSGEG